LMPNGGLGTVVGSRSGREGLGLQCGGTLARLGAGFLLTPTDHHPPIAVVHLLPTAQVPKGIPGIAIIALRSCGGKGCYEIVRKFLKIGGRGRLVSPSCGTLGRAGPDRGRGDECRTLG